MQAGKGFAAIIVRIMLWPCPMAITCNWASITIGKSITDTYHLKLDK